MRRRRVLIILAAGLVLAIAVFAFWPPEPEPRYNGKKLSEWLETADKDFSTIDSNPFRRVREIDTSAPGEVKEAVTAVRVIGTNALPWLLKWATEDHEKWNNWVMNAGESLPRYLHTYRLALSIVRNSGRKQRAAFVGFAILGQKAAPAVPELATLVEKSKSENCRIEAMCCLGALGEIARPALPCLKKHARIYGARERFWTVQVIRNIETDNPEALETDNPEALETDNPEALETDGRPIIPKQFSFP
jgi:hypothetical protein